MKKILLLALLIPMLCFSDGITVTPQYTQASTGTGSVVLSNTPTLTTPAIGAATGTSVSLTAKSSINANAASLQAAPTGNLLQISNTDSSNSNITVDSFGSSSRFQFRRAQGTQASPSAIGNAANLGNFEAWGYGSTGYSAAARAGIVLISEQAWTDANQGAGISFFTTLNGSTTYSEKARFNNVGLLLLGYTSDQGGAEVLQANGSIAINSATLIHTLTAFTNGAGASAGTLTNAPAVGNPTKWIPINDNGTTRYIPAW